MLDEEEEVAWEDEGEEQEKRGRVPAHLPAFARSSESVDAPFR